MPPDSRNFDRSFKLAIIGAAKTGKKTLFESFATEGDDQGLWTSLTVENEKILVETQVSKMWTKEMAEVFDAVASFEYGLEVLNEINRLIPAELAKPVVVIENKIDIVEQTEVIKAHVENEMKNRKKRLYRVSGLKEFNVMHPFAYLLEKLTRPKPKQDEQGENGRKPKLNFNFGAPEKCSQEFVAIFDFGFVISMVDLVYFERIIKSSTPNPMHFPLSKTRKPDMLAARLLGTSSTKFLGRNLHFSRATFLPVVQFKLSDIGEGIAEVQVKEWYIKEGDTISQFDKVCEVQSDKAAVTISSRYDGIVRKLYHNVDDMAKVGQALIDVEIEGEEEKEPEAEPQAEKAKAPSKAQTQAQPETESHNFGKVLATPAVRRIAMENKIKLGEVRGSGKDGRVLKEDVLKYLGQVAPDYSSGSTNIRTTHQAPLPVGKSYEPLKQDTAVPIRGYTRAMIKTMTEALKIPHFGYNDEINVDALVKIRGELKDYAKERHIKLSYMPFFIKAASLALLEYPGLNATTDEKLENVIYKASHNICLAMDTPGGLVVPNIKNCEQRSIFEIAQELSRLLEAGKRQQISRDDLTNGTFTLSNIGAIGGTYASPVIFPPQVAIGAIGKIERLPRFDRDNNVVAANLVKVSWCADHRVVDGATMARFSNRWKFYLEHPSAMLAQLK
ncbi:unnamed protein product [Caenorhabditis angaria]|uniref:Dihydrolipoamide acetyltransferase component of pyruvate dehydrogenase complex n=1 Tax=Caenorhabditis angaria TaxID=860376 RepID=A0A9P1MZ85_9PELO|nr:unnamed protein product [Caenorhabditis angaria]